MPPPVRRAAENPIITPAMVRPSRPDLRVVGVFNPAATTFQGQTLLLLRVAEAPRDLPPSEVAAPVFDAARGELAIHRWRRDTPGIDLSDSRSIGVGGRVWLTSISHLRLARSSDGVRFDIADEPALRPATDDEAYGIEDARITEIDGTWWINYTAVSSRGIATALASTHDFRSFERHGVIFPPDNRDVTIFPERVGGRFVALHRPMPSGGAGGGGLLATPSIWYASSPDLLTWGAHRYVAGARDRGWDDAKVGGGAVPFRVRRGEWDGWLAIYHGVTGWPPTYSLGALLLASDDPSRVLGRSRDPILRPEAPYETEGFFASVVFTCGAIPQGDIVRVYYGAADGVTALADLRLDSILDGLEYV